MGGGGGEGGDGVQGHGDAVILAVSVREAQASAQRHLCAHNAIATIEVLLLQHTALSLVRARSRVWGPQEQFKPHAYSTASC